MTRLSTAVICKQSPTKCGTMESLTKLSWNQFDRRLNWTRGSLTPGPGSSNVPTWHVYVTQGHSRSSKVKCQKRRESSQDHHPESLPRRTWRVYVTGSCQGHPRSNVGNDGNHVREPPGARKCLRDWPTWRKSLGHSRLNFRKRRESSQEPPPTLCVRV